MCKRESLVIALITLGSIVVALVISACVVLAAAPPTPPAGPVVHEVSATNLPIVCLDAEHVGKPVNGCAQTRQRFSSATESSLVRTCPNTPEIPITEQKCPDYSKVVWKRFADVKSRTNADGSTNSEAEIVEVCSVTKEEGAPVSGGNCKASASGSNWSGMRFVWKEAVSHLPPLPPASFTIAPASGVSPLDVVLTWNVPGMTGEYPCTASGDWSEQHAAAGREEIGSVMRSSTYTLTCTDIPPGGAQLSWTKPTTNTDGTPLASPEGYLLSYGNTMLNGAPVLNASLTLPYAQTTYVFSDLLPMRYFFAIQTIGNGGIRSDLSNLVAYEVKPREAQIQRYTGTVKVEVTTKPAPPGELKATDPPAVVPSREELTEVDE
jgi:hypothetical protein